MVMQGSPHLRGQRHLTPTSTRPRPLPLMLSSNAASCVPYSAAVRGYHHRPAAG